MGARSEDWLFCGHGQSASRAADAPTIITTCKNLGMEPRDMRGTLVEPRPW